MEPPGYWDGWEQREETSARKMMSALCGAMYAAVLQYSCHGQQVVMDGALTNPHARRLLVEYLQDWPVYLVGVHCSAQELERRERARGDRSIGLAVSQIDGIHRRMLYDLQIDTTDKRPETWRSKCWRGSRVHLSQPHSAKWGHCRMRPDRSINMDAQGHPRLRRSCSLVADHLQRYTAGSTR
jgi:hypothetical protein